jgi:hypothetical protein
MSYIDDEELKIGIDDEEEEDTEEDLDVLDGFNDPVDDDLELEEDDLLDDEFKGLEDTE